MDALIFGNPVFLGLAAAPLLAVILFAILLPRGRKGTLPLHLALALSASLMLLALSRPALEATTKLPPRALFAFDVSPSVPAGERIRAAEQAASLALQMRQRGIDVRAFVFDASAWPLDALPKPGDLTSIAPDPEEPPSTASRLAPLLLVAAAESPPPRQSGIFLYSDGRFSDDPDLDALPHHLRVHVFPLSPKGLHQTVLSDLALEMPHEEGTPTNASVEIESTTQGSGTLVLHRNGKKIASREVALEGPGKHRLVFQGLSLPRGEQRLQARFQGNGLLPDADPVDLTVRVAGPPRVLLLDHDPPRGLAALKTLRAQGFEMTVASWTHGAAEFPEDFDAVVGVAPPPSSAGSETVRRLARFVAGGGGLLLLAGKAGFGPAFAEGALAKASPVLPPPPALEVAGEPEEPEEKEPEEESEPKPALETPPPDLEEPPAEPPREKRTIEVAEVALVFLIDKSGSMAGKKIRLAKEAAIGAAAELGRGNTVGVLAFDTEAVWLVPLVSAERVAMISDRVSRLQAGGGTNIFPALVKAYHALASSPARIRHVILISDGYNKTLEDFKGIVTKMKEGGVTLSTIGVGEQFDTRLLSSLTYWAGRKQGRFDFTRDFSRIPRLVLQQTRWAIGNPEEEEGEPETENPEPLPEDPPPPPPDEPPPAPEDEAPEPPGKEPPEKEPLPRLPLRLSLDHPSPPFRGIDPGDVPAVYGYRRAEIGPLADVLARAPDGTPVVVVGEHGLGRTLYLGFGLGKAWGADWTAWKDLPKWMGQAIRWVKRKPETPMPPRIAFRRLPGGEVEAVVTCDPTRVAPEKPPRITLHEEGEEEGRSLPVLRSGTRRFLCRFTPPASDSALRLRAAFPPGADAECIGSEARVPPALPFERRHHEPDRERLETIARSTGGLVSPGAAEAVRLSPSDKTALTPLDREPILGALCLLPLTALVRRLRRKGLSRRR